jgi:hypothetical protein
VAWFDDAEDDELVEEIGVPDVDVYMPETFDEYLKAFVMVPKGDEILKAQVVSRRKDHNGNLIGCLIPNPPCLTHVNMWLSSKTERRSITQRT